MSQEAASPEWEVKPSELVMSEPKEVLGKGKSGTVHKAVHPPTGKVVALKVVTIALQNNADEVTRQLGDLYRSTHPNVAAFHGAEYNRAKQCMLIAFEYMSRRSLKDLVVKNGSIPEAVMSIGCKHVLAGLNYLHNTRRIVHRDIKPSNVLVNGEGEFKITDFGMSKELTDAIPQGQTWVGTSLYMSPERVGGEAHSYNADVWSLGIVAVECLTGSCPFGDSGQGDTCSMDMLDNIVDGPPPAVPHDSFSPQAVDFVSLCVTKNARERPGCSLLLDHPFLSLHPQDTAKNWLATTPS
mmetsp:Transcript_70089/g.146147  ORF Transcript_70089/g.146147 Transcript_70089/m.146147 type:complete len:297 (+) Transcript_70089:109-999(+)|eukprot:CAMPEP_0181312524 /NCGR_PEP_ID=MMETSP1101-20121128/13745_1 /TAXON_ID=46948 /ORGANISM="Rhodomonas abbreviata, Strain Caron Lab Isolate" /LENGTH=296 /DNA_ID=CAMNT_0023419385 /DNA_START=104 /DNA_END=994 /DNA_ORIENTATION=-